MSPPQPSAPPAIDIFFQTVHAFHQTAALKAAIELNLFTAIDDGANTAETIAAKCGCAVRGVRILCDYLVTIGWLRKTAHRYELTPEAAAFTSRRSPQYVGQSIEFLLSSPLVAPFQDLTSAVRNGGLVTQEAGTVEGGVVAPDNPVWVQFARAMMPLMGFPAELLAELLVPETQPRECKVLDIAAGHGLYGLAVAQRNPKAEVTALDWENVLAVARENARAAGVSDRYHTIAGSAFDQAFGDGYDLVLLTNFLHHFDAATCTTLLRKVHAALAPAGRAAILEFIPDEDRVSPAVPAQFSLMMLATTPTGDAYTYSQYDELLGKAGFRRTELHNLSPTYFRAVIALK